MPAHPERSAVAGFTLIEAMVALVIISGALLAFYNLLATSLSSANRVAAASLAYDRHMNALEFATTLNPMDNPEGTFDLGAYRLAWSSKPLETLRQSSGYPGGAGAFKVALYRVTLSFPGTDISAIDVTRLGYHRDYVVNPIAGNNPP